MIDMEKFPVLKSLNRFIITFFFVMGVTFNMVAPFSIVKAENDWSYVLLQNTNTVYVTVGGWSLYGYVQNNNSPVAIAMYPYASGGNKLAAVIYSESNFVLYFNSKSDPSSAEPAEITVNYDETNDIYYYCSDFPYGTSDTLSPNIGYFVPEYHRTGRANLSSILTIVSGNLPVDNSYSLGTIEDVKYSTQINSHGDDSVDTISWYPYFDSNNNPAVGWNAQIRVVPGYYYDSDRDSLMQQAFNLFHKEEDQAELIYNDHFVQGSFSITWGDVRNKISITSWQDLFGSFVSVLDGSYWYKRGWIYQIRIYDRDNDLYSEWQDVYTVTSSSGEGVENIIDPVSGGGSADFYNNVENSFNTTSVVNNNYDVTYYYINTPVDTNPSSDDSNEYLKEIRNNVIQIRQLISIDNNANNTPTDNNNPWIGDPAAELYDFEDSSINDFNDAVGDLPTSDLITGNKFLAASTWVRTQYETIVSNTPFEAVIIFSLLLGFGLLLIGKLR